MISKAAVRRSSYQIALIHVEGLQLGSGFPYEYLTGPIIGFHEARKVLEDYRESLKDLHPTMVWGSHFFVGDKTVYRIVKVDKWGPKDLGPY